MADCSYECASKLRGGGSLLLLEPLQLMVSIKHKEQCGLDIYIGTIPKETGQKPIVPGCSYWLDDCFGAQAM